MSDETPVTDDLNAFENEFFNREVKEEVEEAQTEEVAEDETTEEIETETEADEQEVAEEESEEEIEEAEKPAKKTAKDRIQELAKQKNDERERADRLERELADLRKQQEAPKPASVETEANAPDPDALDDKGELIYPLGEFDPKYIADLTKHHFAINVAEAKAEAAREAAESKATQEQEALVSTWETKLTETEETLPDLRDKLADLDETFRGVEPEYGAYLAQAIMTMDRGPEVLYYLANNVAEAQKIVASGPVSAIIALGRLEGLMTEQPEKRDEKKVSKAPTPPTTTRGTSVARKASADTDDLEAFEREFYSKKR